MNTSTDNKKGTSSPASRAEAAVWIARLHGPNRTPEVEAGFRLWLSSHPGNAEAFEHLTDTWEKSARLRRRPVEQARNLDLPRWRVSFPRAVLAAITTAIVAVVGTVLLLHAGGMTTAVGEQRTLSLKDGTRVYLNTNSRIVVQYDDRARRVELLRGEAFFEVAKRPNWPFIVTAGEHQVRALGTAFMVRRDEQQLAITLVEGKVTVSSVTPERRGGESIARAEDSRAQPSFSATDSSTGKAQVSLAAGATSGSNKPTVSYKTNNIQAFPGVSATSSGSAETVTLSPGQRLTFTNDGGTQIDRPSIEVVTAWQRGQIALDNTPLSKAVADMNRYSDIPIVIDDPAAALIKVSGIFRAGDSADFAQAVAKTYGLRATIGSEKIDLSGAPTLTYPRP